MRPYSILPSIVIVLLSNAMMTRTIAVAQEATQAPASTPHAFAGETAWVAYDGGDGIGLIRPDGTGDYRVATDLHDEQHLPDWSPDGTRLVFTVWSGETQSLYEYELATDTTRQLFACEDPISAMMNRSMRQTVSGSPSFAISDPW
jgi:Tol biopolymer transport system component